MKIELNESCQIEIDLSIADSMKGQSLISFQMEEIPSLNWISRYFITLSFTLKSVLST